MRQLYELFSRFVESGTRLSIITKGNVGACRYVLEQEGLLQFFEQVFGMLGQFYGESDFDRANLGAIATGRQLGLRLSRVPRPTSSAA